MMNDINRRIDEIADVAKWIISAHGTTDLKIQDALRMTREQAVEDYGADYEKGFMTVGSRILYGKLIPANVYSIYVKGKHEYIREGKDKDVSISISSAELLGLLDKPLELISPVPDKCSVIPKIIIDIPVDYSKAEIIYIV
jgi:hypothetical protein